MNGKKILISGGGIAGLTLAILLKEKGWQPLVIERDAAMRAEGYMMDFFGTGWDVAERMGLAGALRAIHYPIDFMEYVDRDGKPYLSVPMDRVRNALGRKYVYLRRSDLERILFDRARRLGLAVRFATVIDSIEEAGSEVRVVFNNGETDFFALVFGADGVHSRVRELTFGPEESFARFLGYYVAAFHIPQHAYPIGHSFKLHEEIDRVAGFYPLDETEMDATYIFRHSDVGLLPADRQLALVRERFRGAGWISEKVLADLSSSAPVYFDALTQIVMPAWSQGRIALLGDACGCLTLMAGQGSHMAMAGAYVLARELERCRDDHRAAFEAYEEFLKPFIAKKQEAAEQLSKRFVPSARSNRMIRRAAMRWMFSETFIRFAFRSFGLKSILAGYG